ncbi:hypothetical protein RQP46_008464 [Phenoliferia psychrophenolica]
MLRTLRPVVQATRAQLSSVSPATSRSLHSRVELPYSIDAGLGPFLSPAALKTVAVDWQQGVLDRLNEHVRAHADHSVLETLKQTATDPSQTLAFNYASEALNNSFFLSTLTKSDTPTPHPSRNSALSSAISRSSLESFPSLISHFSAHVSGLHPSSGAYVWLATDQSGNVGVLGTYAGGTLLVHQRKQMGDLLHPAAAKVLGEKLTPKEISGNAAAAAPAPTSTDGTTDAVADAPATPAAGGWTVDPTARKPKGKPAASSDSVAGHLLPMFTASASEKDIGRSILPLACISLHPHCYLADYGVWGREEYVRRWFGAVDWQKVEASYDRFVKRTA